MKLLFFDLETTGTSHIKNAIHQISGEIVIDGVTKEVFDFKVQPHPEAEIEQEALSIAGVTKEQIMAYPPITEVYSKFVSMLAKYVDKFAKTDKFFLVGYNNASFDNQFLREFFERNNDKYFGSWFWSNSLDVMVLASHDLAEKRCNMANFKLMSVAKEYGIEISETKLHDAGYDISLTKSIYELFCKSRNGKTGGVNNYAFANKIDSFKVKILDPQQKRVDEAERIMNDPMHPWTDDTQKNAAKAKLESYRAWLTYYKTFYDEGLRFAGQHENLVNKMSKWYDKWRNDISNEGVQEVELMPSQAEFLNAIFSEMYKELLPLGLDIKSPAALNMK